MINVAILGFGTVGSGVADVLTMNAASIEKKVGQAVNLKYILDVRDFPDSPYQSCFVKDFAVIESDPEVDVVVETIGGARIALEFTQRALQAGKSVVSSNKELVATHGYDLLQLAKANGVSYLFEASVGGGIPILRPLGNCLAANEIEHVTGILNGTTNYILTQMVRNGASFADALKAAQEKGYAEADPTADVEGIDAGRKTCILADLAFGKQVDPAVVPMEGISKLCLEDVDIAKNAGYRVKLLGRAIRLGEGCSAYVAPHLIPVENPISGVEDVFNAVVVKGNATGEVMFYGRGAGELPTASACVADVMEVLQANPGREEISWEENSSGFVDPGVLPARRYFRVSDGMADVAVACGQVQKLAEGEGYTAFVTLDAIDDDEADYLAGKLNVLSSLRVLD